MSAPSAKAQAMQIPARIRHPQTGKEITISSSVGGTLYGTTPGGTRITYDRNALLGYRNSPLSKSPAFLPASIINLGVTNENATAIPEEEPKAVASEIAASKAGAGGDDELFEME